jgi:glutaredoxin
MSEKIYIFTLKGCPHCTSIKKTLKRASIEFVNIDVDANEELWSQVVDQVGYDYVPTVLIYDEGSEESDIFVPSIDYENDEDILRIINERKNKGN